VKPEKPKPNVGKCDTPDCKREWDVVQHRAKKPFLKLCSVCWKKRRLW